MGDATFTGVGLGSGIFDPLEGDSSWGRPVAAAAPVKGTTTTVLVVVLVLSPAARIAEVAIGEAVEEGTGVVVGAITGEFVGVKKRKANASRVRARSMGVAVAVNLGVRTTSGRVSSLSPDITNGI